MGGLQNEPRSGAGLTQRRFFLGLSAPEDERHRLLQTAAGGDDSVGEALPAQILMGIGPALGPR